MTKAYASGNWHVGDGKESEFVDRWREFLGWTRENHPTLNWATLVRAEGDSSRFVSFAEWETSEARDAWKNSKDFMERFTACRELCDEFQGGDFTLAASF